MPNFTVPEPKPYRVKDTRQDIFSAILLAAKRFGPNYVALIDGDERALTYKDIIRGAFALGSALAPKFKRDEIVGILLPTGAGSVVAFCAVLASGRIPSMLNFTAGSANLLSALKTGQIKHVITAHRFVELGALETLIADLGKQANIIYLEDVRENLKLNNKLVGLFGPMAPWLFHKKPKPDKPGVVLFTSGTEGEPKGVVLSHANVLSNVGQVRAVIGLSSEHDILFNPLPTFHSFGLTVGAILPMIAGIRTVCHPSPLQPREIARRIHATKATILLATDTFISQYARIAGPDDLGSIRLAVCGAERVRDETRQFVRQKFDIEILEGYGATEAAPVIAANSVGASVPGTVGQLMPQMQYELKPVEDISEGGILRVKGPNVMLGYMLHSAPGHIQSPQNGWHEAGDIVALDEDGCLRIRGRVKRFAKIGGEMVSPAVVENCASAIWPQDMHAAATLPDPRKGEQIVLLSTSPNANRPELLAWAQSHGVSELVVPRKVIHVPQVPVLGTGKINYGEVNQIVQSLGMQ